MHECAARTLGQVEGFVQQAGEALEPRVRGTFRVVVGHLGALPHRISRNCVEAQHVGGENRRCERRREGGEDLQGDGAIVDAGRTFGESERRDGEGDARRLPTPPAALRLARGALSRQARPIAIACSGTVSTRV